MTWLKVPCGAGGASLSVPRRSLALFFAALLGCLLSVPALAQTRRLSVVCSVQLEWCELVKNEYQKASGVRMTMIHRSSIDALAMLLAERNNPRTDVWFGGTGDPHLQAAEQKITLEYKSPLFEELQPWAQAQAERAAYRSVGLYSGVLIFAYRPDQLRRIHADAPKCWRDLVSPVVQRPVDDGASRIFRDGFPDLGGADADLRRGSGD